MKQRFSERAGLVNVRVAFQRGMMSDRLKNRLWSACQHIFFDHFHYEMNGDYFTKVVTFYIQDSFFGLRTSQLNPFSLHNIKNFEVGVLSLKWNEFYDFIDFMGDFSNRDDETSPWPRIKEHGVALVHFFNRVLEEEKSAYRFISGQLVEITDDREISSIEDALSLSDKFSGSKIHLKTAVALFANREKPDYRNSIKESISSIESAFTAINGERSQNLPTALKLAEKAGLSLHPALMNGISNIYGWTSNEAGIRHSLIDGDAKVDEADAKFMLVLCSTFLNYLAVK